MSLSAPLRARRRPALVCLLWLASACQTTAEADDPAAAAGPPPADAGSEAPPAAASPPGAASPRAAAPDGGPSADLAFVHNQLIVKPKPAADGERPGLDALRRAVEAATGARVAELRPGPVNIVLIVFAPTDPPRDATALAGLQAALEATDAYEYVQPNRLYEAKTGEGGQQEAPSP